MKFASMIYIYLLPAVVLLLGGLFYRGWKKRKLYLGQLVAKKWEGKLMDNYSRRMRLLKNGLILMGIILGVIALARPQMGHSWEEQRGRGIDMLFILDTSKSMLAEDVKPNRLDRAKFAILDLVQKLKGHRLG